jgi:hypothetical protein
MGSSFRQIDPLPKKTREGLPHRFFRGFFRPCPKSPRRLNEFLDGRRVDSGAGSLGGTPQTVTFALNGIVVVPATLALAAIGIGLGGWMALRRRK